VDVVRRQRSGLREWRTFLPMLLRAAVTTVWVTCGGMILAVTLGLALAIVKQYAPAPLRWMAVAYIEVFRGTPLLLQIYFIYFGLAQQLGLKLSAGAAAVLALGLNYAATEAENYRAGLLSVPRGQMEAALALGMKQRVALRRVLLPQALRISLPSVTNDFIAMFKDSSIVSVIALVELTKEFQIRAIDTGDYLGLGLMTAGIYFAMSWTASLGARRIERMLHHDHR
jgi:polar amino acid transport system substrate-binding protein